MKPSSWPQSVRELAALRFYQITDPLSFVHSSKVQFLYHRRGVGLCRPSRDSVFSGSSTVSGFFAK